MPTIILTDPFNNDFRKLSPAERKQAGKTLRFMAINPKHNLLKIHWIKGTGFWKVYVNKGIRVVFEQNSNTLILYAIGYHDIL